MRDVWTLDPLPPRPAWGSPRPTRLTAALDRERWRLTGHDASDAVCFQEYTLTLESALELAARRFGVHRSAWRDPAGLPIAPPAPASEEELAAALSAAEDHGGFNDKYRPIKEVAGERAGVVLWELLRRGLIPDPRIDEAWAYCWPHGAWSAEELLTLLSRQLIRPHKFGWWRGDHTQLVLGCLDEPARLLAAEHPTMLTAPLRGCLITLGVLDESALTPDQRRVVARNFLHASDPRVAGLDGVRVAPPAWTREALAATTTRWPPTPRRLAPFVDHWRPEEVVAALCHHHHDMGDALALLDGRPGLDDALLDRALELVDRSFQDWASTITALALADRWGADWPPELDVLLRRAVSDNTCARDPVASARLVAMIRALPPERRARLLLEPKITKDDARARYLEAHPADEVLDAWLDAQLSIVEQKSLEWRDLKSFLEHFTRVGDVALRRLLAALERHTGARARQLLTRAITMHPDLDAATLDALLADPAPEVRGLIGGYLRARRPSRLTPPAPEIDRRARAAHEAWVHPRPNVSRCRPPDGELPGYGPIDLDFLRALLCERAERYVREEGSRADMVGHILHIFPEDQVAPLLAALLANAPPTAWIEGPLSQWLSPSQPTPLSRATAAAVVAEMRELPTPHDDLFARWLARGCSTGNGLDKPHAQPGVADEHLVSRLAAPGGGMDRLFFGALRQRGLGALPALHAGLGDPATRPGCAALLRRLADPRSIPHLAAVGASEALRACRLVAAPDDDDALAAELASEPGAAPLTMRWSSGRPLPAAAAGALYSWLESQPNEFTGWYDDPGLRRAAARLHPETRAELRAALPPAAALALVDPAPVTELLDDAARRLSATSNFNGLWFAAWDGTRDEVAPERYRDIGALAPAGSALGALRQLLVALEPHGFVFGGRRRANTTRAATLRRVDVAYARLLAARGRDLPFRHHLEIDHALELLVEAAALARMEFFELRDGAVVVDPDPQTHVLLADPDGARAAVLCWVFYG